MLCHSLHLSVFASAEVFCTNHKGHRQKNSALIIVSFGRGPWILLSGKHDCFIVVLQRKNSGRIQGLLYSDRSITFLDRNTVRKERECVFLTFSTNMDVCF